MDECIPPVIRNRKWFMYPFFYYAYRGRNISQTMNFKKHYREWSPHQLQQFYESLNSISINRKTDISEGGLKLILKHCAGNVGSVLDVGCGKGFLLDLIQKHFPGIQLHGADFVAYPNHNKHPFTQTDARKLPFPDKSFDLVICTHTIEHISPAEDLVKELKRVARDKLIVITPRQKYFYYTLDEHVNFFPQQADLTSLMDMKVFECSNIEGDWVYIGYL